MSTTQLVSNQYYIYITPEEGLIPWDIFNPNPENCGFVAYFGKVLQAVETHLKQKGLTFYITMTELRELPSYGKDVVVIMLGDELCRIPKYAHKVGAIFKCYGTQQILGCNPLLKPSYLNLVTTIQFLRNWIVRLPWILQYQMQKIKGLLSGRRVAPIYDIPLGYYNSENLPIKDISERLYDVYFAGSAVHERYSIWSLQYWLRTPKTVSRQQMISSLNRFKEKHPEYKIESSVTQAFGAAGSSEVALSYNEKMMNTKICLAPRGTSFETYRFYEAIKYGCIVVTEALPPRWFYDGAPNIKVTDWLSLEETLEKLLKNQQLLQEIHQQSLNWWQTKCSEDVVGKYIAEKLNLHFMS
ncbi:glycosyltransferase family 1 protein [Iningainema tapete]|uniref:Glycosyltransferase family 1 protein n=1 Tax=Iningainema tapete BLCC-T55 TaxID=2748662 RepID=A0A8J6XMU2_9CYAN|nr:glycosyltransferase family 1 protein [Iningainema tapete]MBD2777908.1 glycosyltransferase family 1 protein [Iningainema tapete BLCC-T55]